MITLDLTFQNIEPHSAGVTAQRRDREHQRAVLLGLAQVRAPVVEQHHGLVASRQQPVPGVLVRDDVLESQAATSSAADDSAEADVGGARDVGQVERQERAAVQHEAAGHVVPQPAAQGRTVDCGDIHDDHSRASRQKWQIQIHKAWAVAKRKLKLRVKSRLSAELQSTTAAGSFVPG